MARITVEDCLKKVPNRFKLTLVATYRARELAQGHTPRLESRHKPTVTALRESLPVFDAANLTSYADFVLTIGGDGAILTAARVAAPHGIPVIGVQR